MEREDFDIRDNQLTSRERDFENALRPLSFEDFSGQDKVVDNLRIFVKAARLRGEALDHVLLHGPPGLGKRHFPILLRMNWELVLKLLPVRSLINRVIWRECLPVWNRMMCCLSMKFTAFLRWWKSTCTLRWRITALIS